MKQDTETIVEQELQEIEKIKKKPKKKRKKPNWKKIKPFLWIFLLIEIICICGIGLYFGIKTYDKMSGDITETVEKTNQIIANMSEDDFNSRVPTTIYDKDGNVLKEIKTVDYIYRTYEELNPEVFDALVAVEDNRFYEHDGLDLKGFTRAMYYTFVKHQTQGGSTITQQLAKNVYLTMEQTVWRKFSEAIIANELETRYTKHQILEFYVNNINYGNGCYSIESAANYYFGKNTTELSIAEIAFLTGIPNNPTVYNPLTNFDNANSRKEKVLNAMKREHMITETEYKEECNREIVLTVSEKNIDNLITDYAQNYAINKAVESLMKYYGFEFKYDFNTEEERSTYFQTYSDEYKKYYSEILSGGYDIYTSIDTNIQNTLQSIVNSEMSRYTQINENTGIYMKQSSATIIDNRTGLVVGIVGGRTQDGVDNSYNRAYLGARQPGSTIKPLIVYTPAMELGYNANSTLNDSAISGGPSNAYSGYYGNVSLRFAVEQSINTTAYKLTQEIGIENSLNYLSKMNFKYLSSIDKQSQTIGLGGFTYGVTTVEMASAYSTLARNGQYIDATNVTKVYDRTSKTTIYENSYEKKKIYDDGAAYLMTDVLHSVITHGTGKPYQLNGVSAQAGKTGTTNNAKDLWFCGYTPNYSMAVWVGDDTPSEQGDITAQGYIWKKMMSTLSHGSEFERPASVYEENGVLKYSKEASTNLTKVNEEKEQSRKNTEKTQISNFTFKTVNSYSINSLAEKYISLFENYTVSDVSEFPTIQNMITNGDKLMELISDTSLKAKYEKAKETLQNKVEILKSTYESDNTETQKNELWNKIKSDFYTKKPTFVRENTKEETPENPDKKDEETEEKKDNEEDKKEETPEEKDDIS